MGLALVIPGPFLPLVHIPDLLPWLGVEVQERGSLVV